MIKQVSIEEGMRELSSNRANSVFTDHDLKAEIKKESYQHTIKLAYQKV
jgi:hypothetical protein